MATEIERRTGQIVAHAMVNAGMTKLQLAEESGIPYSTLGRRLRGVQPFDLVEIFLISQALGVSPASLLPDEFAATEKVAS